MTNPQKLNDWLQSVLYVVAIGVLLSFVIWPPEIDINVSVTASP